MADERRDGPRPVSQPAYSTGRIDTVERYERPRVVRRISPSAVLAGAALALVVLFLLNLLGVSIGLTTIDPTRGGGGTPGLGEFGTGAAIWGVVSFLIALGVGGWVAGRLAGDPKKLDSALHGLIAWALATLVLMWLMTTAVSNLIGGAFSVVGNAASASAQTIQAAITGDDGGGQQGASGGGDGGGVLQQVPWQQIQQQAQQILSNVNVDRQQVIAAVQRLLTGGGSEADRQTVIDVLTNQVGMSPEEAESMLQGWIDQYQQAVAQIEQQAAQAAEATADALSWAAFWSFIALLLGAIAAGGGGWVGAPRDEISGAVRSS